MTAGNRPTETAVDSHEIDENGHSNAHNEESNREGSRRGPASSIGNRISRDSSAYGTNLRRSRRGRSPRSSVGSKSPRRFDLANVPEITDGHELLALPDVEWGELINSVEHFGLSERESILYLSLLRRGRATARELAGDVGVDRVLSYRLLDAMCARGIVEITVERPRRYAPVPPGQFFDRNLEERRRALAHDERMAQELADRISRMATTKTHEAARFMVLSGNRAAYGYLREMMGRARQEVAVMITHRALRDSAEQGLPRAVLQLLRSGGRFRLIVEADPRVRPMLTRYLSALEKFPHGEVRYLAPQSARLTIVDHGEALVFLVPEARPRGIEEVAMWTNTSEFVEGQLHQFNVVWEVAGRSVEPPRPPRARRGRTRASSRDTRKV